jgi:hypothetical protein
VGDLQGVDRPPQPTPAVDRRTQPGPRERDTRERAPVGGPGAHRGPRPAHRAPAARHDPLHAHHALPGTAAGPAGRRAHVAARADPLPGRARRPRRPPAGERAGRDGGGAPGRPVPGGARGSDTALVAVARALEAAR